MSVHRLTTMFLVVPAITIHLSSTDILAFKRQQRNHGKSIISAFLFPPPFGGGAIKGHKQALCLLIAKTLTKL